MVDLGELDLVKRHILFSSIKVLDVTTVLKIRVRLASLTASVIVAGGYSRWVVAAIVAVLSSSGVALDISNLRGQGGSFVLHILNV